jgi:hypothetical protein
MALQYNESHPPSLPADKRCDAASMEPEINIRLSISIVVNERVETFVLPLISWYK